MDSEVQFLVMGAFDEVLTHVADMRMALINQGLSDEEVAENILDSLDSFRGLREGLMPDYTVWDAVFYGTWYQPAHINMVYSLIKNASELNLSLANVKGTLLIRDFGCGEMAMAFGLALAAFDLALEGKPVPDIALLAEDISLDMKKFGTDLLAALGGYLASCNDPRLTLLADVVKRIRLVEETETADMAWLSVLHVAYPDPENKAAVKQAVDALVNDHAPAWVIVSSHRRRYGDAYTPDLKKYSSSHRFGISACPALEFELDGTLPKVTAFRQALLKKYCDYLNRIPTLARYLNNDVRWVLPQEGNIIDLYQPIK